MDQSPVITSAKNPHVKQLRKLATSHAARSKLHQTLAHGAHLVRSCLESDLLTPQLCVYAESAGRNAEVTELLHQLPNDTHVLCVSDDIYRTLSDIHADVGISIVCAIAEHLPPAAITQSAVLLDQVQDPGNLGTILRTTAASGVTSVYLSPGCASAWSPKALRAGMGAQFILQIYENIPLLPLIQTTALQTCTTTLSARSVSLYDVPLSQPTVWIFGSEGQGVSPELLTHTSQHVRIPQANTPVESLNVAAAAAVCLYEQFRQANHG